MMEAFDARIDRRLFLRLTGLAGIAAAAPRLGAQQPVDPPRPRISVQLYSIRDWVANKQPDGKSQPRLPEALRQLAEWGAQGVEFAGYYNYWGKGRELRKLLDDCGLVASGTHIGTGSFRGDNLKRTIDFHQAIGCKYLIVPSDRDYTDPEKSKPLAELFNQVAEKLKPLGMKCGYHNHTGEFKTLDGKTYYDLFAERTSQDVVIQQDCGWSAAAGKNPAELIRRYPGRSGTLHFKPTVLRGDQGKKAYFGQDSVAWDDVFLAAWKVGGCEWMTLEQERYPDGKSSMECTRISLDGMRAMLARH